MTVVVAPISSFSFSQDDVLSICSEICNWERLEYGEGKHRLPENLFKCIGQNDSTFFCAFDDGRLIGYADLWQLKASFYKVMVSGIMAEEQIMNYQIVGREDPPSARWYVGSVITCPDLREVNHVRSAQVFMKLFHELYSVLLSTPYPAKVMGVGSSAFGEKLLERHGFVRVEPTAGAIDLRPRFEKSLEALELSNLDAPQNPLVSNSSRGLQVVYAPRPAKAV